MSAGWFGQIEFFGRNLGREVATGFDFDISSLSH
jgi:hypothetical protein